MSLADKIYRNMILDIYEKGDWDYGEDVRTKYADGTPAYAKSLFGYQVKFPKGVVPLITTKKVFTKTAIKEMLLFWVHQTVKIKDFKDWNVNIWNEWEMEDGTIGKSYAAQFQKGDRNQVVELLRTLKENPKSRRHMTCFWDFENAPKKALQECCWATQWDVRKGDLNLLLLSRSCDTALGWQFNIFQYYVLQCLIAKVSGLNVGSITMQIGNMHYYDRHEKLLLEQIENEYLGSDNVKVLINESLEDFFDTKLEDIEIFNFKCLDKIYNYEVAI